VKNLRILLVSIGVCVFVGIPVSTFFYGVLNGTPSLAMSVDLAGVPIIAYGFISGFPIAVAAGLFAAALVLALLRSKRWNSGWRGWALAGSGLGVVTAGGFAILLWTIGWMDDAGVPTLFALIGPSGAFCGAVIGLHAWREMVRMGRRST
jgi:hypothetical protein